jgi:uncharacterized protein
MRKFVWAGSPGTFRVEVAHVALADDRMSAEGTQIGLEDEPYELRYRLETANRFAAQRLEVAVVGGGSLMLEQGESDAFDLAYSPLFNSLPVLRHGLHVGGGARDFVMTWISVPGLEVSRSQQRYDPLSGEGLVRFVSEGFTADIEFDGDGFVVSYPEIAERVWPSSDSVF